ncbi:MAG: DUF4157 domain-containing protein [Chloroflexi bacterium]|nr:DUF4157 domain-containing protein [Chloroflexota bacterium]
MSDKLPAKIPACAANLLARPEWFADPEIVDRVQVRKASRFARFISSKRFANTEISAVTLGHTIHMRKPEKFDPHSPSGLALLAHEIKHVEQYEQRGRLKFYTSYLWDYARGRYKKVSLEKQAYEFDKVVEDHLKDEFRANSDAPCEEQADPHTPNDAFAKIKPQAL